MSESVIASFSWVPPSGKGMLFQGEHLPPNFAPHFLALPSSAAFCTGIIMLTPQLQQRARELFHLLQADREKALTGPAAWSVRHVEDIVGPIASVQNVEALLTGANHNQHLRGAMDVLLESGKEAAVAYITAAAPSCAAAPTAEGGCYAEVAIVNSAADLHKLRETAAKHTFDNACNIAERVAAQQVLPLDIGHSCNYQRRHKEHVKDTKRSSPLPRCKVSFSRSKVQSAFATTVHAAMSLSFTALQLDHVAICTAL
jgi:hypothetical protein